MSDQVQHHWHEPTQGQVTKAMYQYLTDQGFNSGEITKVIEAKLDKVVTDVVNRLIGSKRFDEMIIQAVAAFVKSEKACFDNSTYTWRAHIGDLVKEKIKSEVLSKYVITITEKG